MDLFGIGPTEVMIIGLVVVAAFAYINASNASRSPGASAKPVSQQRPANVPKHQAPIAELSAPMQSPSWLNDLLALHLEDGPSLVSGLTPFIDWLGEGNPVDVQASVIPQLAAHWQVTLGPVQTSATLSAMQRLYADLTTSGRPIDPAMMATLVQEQMKVGAGSAAGTRTGSLGGRVYLDGVDISMYPQYWQDEFLRFHQQGAAYQGRFNWAAFWFGPLWGLFRDAYLSAVLWSFVALVAGALFGALSGGVLTLPTGIALGFFFAYRGNYLRYMAVVKRQQVVK